MLTVTGGAGGLGFEASKALLEHGLECLAIFDITKDQGNQAALELRRLFSTKIIIFHQVNISNDEEIRTAVAEVVTRFKQIDILLSFAGIVHCEHALNAPIEEWRKVQDVNVNGQFTVAQTVAKAMVSIKHKDLSMVFVASVSGHTVNFPQPQAAYNTSKAAVIHMMHSLAAEWARYGIRVNSISPGYMDTRLNEGEELEEARQVWRSRTPMGRMGRRDELNGAVLLLCSAAGAYITGTDIKVDGKSSFSLLLFIIPGKDMETIEERSCCCR